MNSISYALQEYGLPWQSSPRDILRPAFMRHVVGPLAHTAVVAAIEMHGDDFLSELAGPKGQTLRASAAVGTRSFDPARHGLDLLIKINGSFQRFAARRGLLPISDICGTRQQAALYRFFSRGHATTIGRALLAEVETIPVMAGLVAAHHPEYKLEAVDSLLPLLQSGELSRLARRGFNRGGSGFIDGLRGVNNHPVTAPWHDLRRPLVTQKGRGLYPTAEIVRASQEHRIGNARRTEIDADAGLARMAMVHSGGCPAHAVGFRTDTADMVQLGLQLRPPQLEALHAFGHGNMLSEPVPGQFAVRQHSYERATAFLAAAVSEVVACA